MIGETACNSKRPWIICAEAKCIPANGDSAGEAGIEVLDLSSVDAGSIVLDPEPICCAEAISEVSDGVKAIASAKGITVSVEIDDGDQIVIADKTRLRQILLNLMSNAIKYSDHDGSVRLSVTRSGADAVLITVEDEGWGIPESRREELFAPFARLGRKSSAIDGVGLGLALTQRLARLMDGDIAFEPRAGGGSIFTIRLPAGDAVAVEDRPKNSEVDLVGPARAITVLYIEDNVFNAQLMEGIISIFDPSPNLLIAKTGAEGVNLAENHRPDILLLDVELPDMDGFAVLDQLNERMGATAPPVVIVTADATEATRRRATSPLIREFITKPYEISVIARICCEVSEDRETEAR